MKKKKKKVHGEILVELPRKVELLSMTSEEFLEWFCLSEGRSEPLLQGIWSVTEAKNQMRRLTVAGKANPDTFLGDLVWHHEALRQQGVVLSGTFWFGKNPSTRYELDRRGKLDSFNLSELCPYSLSTLRGLLMILKYQEPVAVGAYRAIREEYRKRMENENGEA